MTSLRWLLWPLIALSVLILIAGLLGVVADEHADDLPTEAAASASRATGGGDDLRTISHHTSAGTGYVSEATEVVIAQPDRVLFKIRVKPNVRVEGKYIHYCRSGEGDRDGTTERFKTRSKVFEMPVFFSRTKACQFYAEVARDKPRSNVAVKLAIRVLAEQRPGAPSRPTP